MKMIIRKPYAFLIKYFRQIHVVLLVLAAYIYYKITTLHAFINGYIDTEVYNKQIDSIRNYVSPLLYLAILLVLAGTFIILILLRQKKKPRITYILILVEYTVLFILALAASSYFNGLNGASINSAQIRLIRDFLAIFSFFQFPIFLLLVVRILGIDLQRFGFQGDEEFLQASEEDREEIEVGLNIDKDIYINKIKKQLRHFKYYYFENKFILNIVIGFFAILLCFSIGKFVLSFKSYKQGKSFVTNGYTITINNVYTSKYGSNGIEIEKGQNFVVLDATIVNHLTARSIDTDHFLLMSNKETLTPTTKYNDYFKDLGTPYNKSNLQSQKEYRYLIVYKASDDFVKGKYTLYYAMNAKRIKIKIAPKNYNKKSETTKYKFKRTANISGKKFKITNYEFADSIRYLYDSCSEKVCSVLEEEKNVSDFGNGYKILELDLDSDDYDGYSFFTFLKENASIDYKVYQEKKSMKIVSPLDTKYKGDRVYLLVNSNLTYASEIALNIKVRTDSYEYKLK